MFRQIILAKFSNKITQNKVFRQNVTDGKPKVGNRPILPFLRFQAEKF